MQKKKPEGFVSLSTGKAFSRRRFIRGFALAGLGLAGGMGLLPSTTCGRAGDPIGSDPVQRRAYESLAIFTDWLRRERARGYVGEVNWPNDLGRGFGDEARWNALGEGWYRRADTAGLWVTAWCVDEGQLWGGFWLSVHASEGDGETRPISRPLAQAPVVERHPGAEAYKRGLNVSGGEKWEDGVNTNADPGAYGSDYWYAGRRTMDYLAERGTEIIRLPFRWERLQPRLGGALDDAELSRLRACVSRARAAGLGVVLDLHNYGEYWMAGPGGPEAFKVGSPQLPHALLGDLWGRLSRHFGSDPGVVAYDLMNEPYNHGEVPSTGYPSSAAAWEAATRVAVAAIRRQGDGKKIMIPGHASIHEWAEHHPRRWIDDPADNHAYTAHHYFDAYRGDETGGGNYIHSYEEEIEHWRRRGY